MVHGRLIRVKLLEQEVELVGNQRCDGRKTVSVSFSLGRRICYGDDTNSSSLTYIFNLQMIVTLNQSEC